MEKEKKQKILKIVGWVLIAVAVIAIVAMNIVSCSYRKDADDLNDKNSQIEDILDDQNNE